MKTTSESRGKQVEESKIINTKESKKEPGRTERSKTNSDLLDHITSRAKLLIDQNTEKSTWELKKIAVVWISVKTFTSSWLETPKETP